MAHFQSSVEFSQLALPFVGTNNRDHRDGVQSYAKEVSVSLYSRGKSRSDVGAAAALCFGCVARVQ